MKTRNALMIFILLAALLTACGQTAQNGTTTTPTLTITTPTLTITTTPATTTDAVTSASIVDNAAAFEKAISSAGTWIIAITKDVTVDKDISLDGEFKNGKKDTAGNEIIQRKVALYAQDADRNITARYTLTAPKFTITSPEASIQHGTFKGDLYVSVKDFSLVDATVDGSVYFTTDEAKSTFVMDATSKVSGVQELKK
jgi:hypothetical protein